MQSPPEVSGAARWIGIPEKGLGRRRERKWACLPVTRHSRLIHLLPCSISGPPSHPSVFVTLRIRCSPARSASLVPSFASAWGRPRSRALDLHSPPEVSGAARWTGIPEKGLGRRRGEKWACHIYIYMCIYIYIYTHRLCHKSCCKEDAQSSGAEMNGM